MNLKLRKFFIWSISLVILVGIYMVYNHFSKTPKIVIDTGKRTIEISTDFDREIGMLGDVGVGEVKVAEFINLDDDRKLDRKWGFAKLLHSTGNQWELEKPYMTIFRDDYKCYITAERGDILLEQGVKSPSPKDATLTGDVIIYIKPGPESEVSETTIYFDYLVYLSDRSLFTTAGPVRIVSEEVELTGKGMELIYNEQDGRLEFLRITHLDSLNLKRAASKPKKETAKLEQPKVHSTENIYTASPQSQPVAIAHTSAPNTQKQDIQTTDQAAKKEKPTELYRCVFRKNVVMELSEQIVFADEFFINNMELASKPVESQGSNSHVNISKAPQQTAQKVSEPTVTKVSKTNAQKEKSSKAVSSKVETETKTEGPENVIITCDGGIFVTPMSTPVSEIDFEELLAEDTVTNGNIAGDIDKASFVARKISYDAISENVILEGDSKCSMLEDHNDIQQKYMLSAPKILVTTNNSKKKTTSGPAPGIEHLTASGGTVQLATSKYRDDELLGFVKLKCTQFDYDSVQEEIFWATGPGVIAVDNSKIAEPNDTDKKTDKFSLQKPCYAVIRNFKTLTYSLATKQVVADADSQAVLIDYIPVVDGEYGQQVSMTANHIVGNFIETDDGRSELTTLSASDGVTYEEQPDENAKKKSRNAFFAGSNLLYDRSKSLITVWGNEFQPCLLNGISADAIKHDLKTGKTSRARLVGPGILK